MTTSRIFVANLPGWSDEGVVIAAARAGAEGVVNLEGLRKVSDAERIVETVARFARRPFSVRIDSDSDIALDFVSRLPASVDRVFLTYAPLARLKKLVKACGDRELWLEVTSAAQAQAASKLGCKGILAKGHEAGGIVGEETSFVLLQRLVSSQKLPVILAGGVGRHSAGAVYTGGGFGVWLDVQLALTPESTLPDVVKEAIQGSRGDEAICLGRSSGTSFRVFRRPGMSEVAASEDEYRQLEASGASEKEIADWRRRLVARINWTEDKSFWPLGQDSFLAASLTKDFKNVSGIVQGLTREIAEHVRAAREEQPWRSGSPLAASHGTKFPLLQGPMTRVSDCAPFALEVAKAGGLPFLALALLRAGRVRETLEETRRLLAEKPWGVGILGFVPPELRTEQLEVVREIRPSFALIAGGRPDQAAELEREGIATYLHSPSPSLLESFLDQGARRFILEGGECGGHVGPRTSFVLWEQSIAVLLAAIDRGVVAEELHVVFAGGISDARSAAMVAAFSASLFTRGVRVGLLMGTAYLFTREAVESGAIVEGFQRRAIECEQTVVLESGPGHVTRCAPTPFAESFRAEKKKLLASGAAVREVRDRLEDLNVGRLRIASKGIERGADAAAGYITVDAKRQAQDGMYMIGQAAALHRSVRGIDDLHEDVSTGSQQVLAGIEAPAVGRRPRPAPEPPCDVAIVGMSCLFPGARNHLEFWENIVNKRDAITEVPRDRFNVDLFYDRDKKARDKVYSQWGGFLSPVEFDPLRFGIPPSSLASIDPMQLLSLLIVDQALADAGYTDREFDREHTSVIFGMSGGLGDLGIKYAVRSSLPNYIQGLPEEVLQQLPEWTEDSFAGILMNVTSGRIANRLNFGGVNFTVDAACASSLSALYLGVRELNHGGSDMVVVGGADTVQSPFGYMCFSSSRALSERGKCRPFSNEADGIAISEGVGALILRRLEDAERDGDRVYAVIKGVQGSSDGRGRGLTAPLPAGQMRVLRRAYAQAGFSPATVGLIEAHGTGTVAGDAAEIESLSAVFAEEKARPGSCSIGSVKSMIGHTKSTAGVAGLMKVALSLYHGVQPPTLHVDSPNPKLRSKTSPFFVNVEAQPWAASGPRRAGVSSFGFGGTNFHAALEEYVEEFRPAAERPATMSWPAELFYWESASREKLAGSLEAFARDLDTQDSLSRLASESWRRSGTGGHRAVIIATSPQDLQQKAVRLGGQLQKGEEIEGSPDCLYFAGESGDLALLFSGQGSQRPFMLRELALRFPELQETLGQATEILDGYFDRPLANFIYPPHPFSDEEADAQKAAITDTAVAQPALGVIETGLLRVLRRLGAEPQMTAGHSYGEYVALHAGGVFDAATLFRLSAQRGAYINQTTGANQGTMAAVSADRETAERIVARTPGVVVANYNGPKQSVLAGSEESIQAALKLCEQERVAATRIPVACAFHSPLMGAAAELFSKALGECELAEPAITVYSNTSAEPHASTTSEIAAALTMHLTSPVRFVEQIERMYADGARVFLEVGPGAVLARLTKQILQGREDVVVLACEEKSGDPTIAFLRTLGMLAVRGRLPQGRELFRGRLAKPAIAPAETSWRATGGGVFRPGEMPRAPKPVVISSQPAVSAAPSIASVTPPVVHTAPVQHAPQPLMSPAPLVASSSAPFEADGEIERVMLEHHRLMERFLSTQSELMAAFLGTPVARSMEAPFTPVRVATTPAAATAVQPQPAPEQPSPVRRESVAAPVSAAPVSAVAMDWLAELTRIASERTGYPAELLDPAAALEADLGVDSIKRVEIIGALQKGLSEEQRSLVSESMDRLNGAASLQELAAAIEKICAVANSPAAAVPAQTAVIAAPAVTTAVNWLAELTRIASERTGYPAELLDPAAALEADLGVDSIKRVEIIGALQKGLSEEQRSLVSESMDRLNGAPSLRELATALEKICGGANSPAAPHPQTAAIAAPAVTPTVNWLVELTRIASERTGYPAELLDPAAALEADLGVDSIKRVEIIGALQKGLSEQQRSLVSESMDRLNGAASLQALAASIEAVLSSVDAADSQPGPSRLVLAIEPLSPRPDAKARPGRTTLVVFDGSARAMEIASLLRKQGENPVLIQHGTFSAADETRLYSCDLTSADEVSQIVQRVGSQHGPIGAVLHLVALNAPSEAGNVDASLTEIRKVVKSGFLFLRESWANLEAVGSHGGARFAVVTARGGGFGLVSDQRDRAHLASSTSLADFVKAAAAEEPNFRCKIIDVGSQVASDEICAEFCCDDEVIQVGLSNGSRSTIGARIMEIDQRARPNLPADPVFLITGGARGVTSQIAQLVGAQKGARLVLVGSTAIGTPETQELAALAGPALKAEILKQLRAKGAATRPVDIESEFGRIMRMREIRASLDGLRALGAKVDYHAVDVRNTESFGQFLDEVYEKFGRIDVVIHGAGIIEDKLIRDKTPESFDRVFETKAASSLVLAQKLRHKTLSGLIFMSSISAAFGNRGQADYAAANGVMNGLALDLRSRWGISVTAINWGPWDQRGMVSDGVREQFKERGIALVPLQAGAIAAIAEIAGSSQEAIVVIGDGPWCADARIEKLTNSSRGDA